MQRKQHSSDVICCHSDVICGCHSEHTQTCAADREAACLEGNACQLCSSEHRYAIRAASSIHATFAFSKLPAAPTRTASSWTLQGTWYVSHGKVSNLEVRAVFAPQHSGLLYISILIRCNPSPLRCMPHSVCDTQALMQDHSKAYKVLLNCGILQS